MIKNKFPSYKFKSLNLLEQALAHRSCLNENKNLFTTSNERMEFLGDAVLELWVSSYLFTLFPNKDEGELTNLRSLIVRTENLADIAKNLHVGDFLYLSRGEETHGGRENISILADTLEAIIGAVFLDSNYSTVSKLLAKIIGPSIDTLSAKDQYKDSKSFFQEIAQAKEGITPNYQVISETGPDHNKTYVCAVFIGTRKIAEGSGNSKQRAEGDAARNAILCYYKTSI